LLDGKVVAITGGTGSFGQTMATHLLQTNVAEVRVVSRDEAKQDLLRHNLADSRLKCYLGDVRDRQSLRQPFRGADFLFHAAALKQVPSGEFFPSEIVSTNVVGSQNVFLEATEAQISSVVSLSTDKAVYPINAMGLSKGLMEKAAIANARMVGSGTTFCVTRYGNVLYSRGSVLPLFVQQLKQGLPLTITNPHMTRFLMSLQESIDLVLFAFSQAENGSIYVKKASSATIMELAESVQRVFNSQVGHRLIGSRHGEKLFETLLSEEELPLANDKGDYFAVPMDVRGLDYGLYFDEGNQVLDSGESFNSHNAERLSEEDLDRKLLALPEIQMELENWQS